MAIPTVQKLRRGGYDGRGVPSCARASDAPLRGRGVLRRARRLSVTELAVIVARSSAGEVATYPVVEMEFDPEANICSRVSVPARIDERTEAPRARSRSPRWRRSTAVGVVAVELFLTVDGALLVNELAPRPHNSGHLTIEACATSQFEQHLRAITGPSARLRRTLALAAVMVNVLGAVARERVAPVLPGRLAELLAFRACTCTGTASGRSVRTARWATSPSCADDPHRARSRPADGVEAV